MKASVTSSVDHPGARQSGFGCRGALKNAVSEAGDGSLVATVFAVMQVCAVVVAVCAGLGCGSALAQLRPADIPPEPEAATGSTARTLARATKLMIASANPYATQAGLEILRAGGSAADAAITVQLVLNLVEPQSSGIGGGAFMLHWDEKTRTLKAYDGRERAPLSASEERFLLDNGRPMAFEDAVASPLSVGVPGVIALLELAHRAHGKLPWARVIEPAIALAEQGFRISPRLNELLALQGPGTFAPTARAYFYNEQGLARPVGQLLRNEAFAASLRAIQKSGAAAFYTGAIAREIVEATGPKALEQSFRGRKPSEMNEVDLAAYTAKERQPVCAAYRTHRICGMPPPSSGGITVAQILGLIEPLDLGVHPLNRQGVHVVVEAEKLAYADRNLFIADPDFIKVPEGLLNASYIAQRHRLIDLSHAKPRAMPGNPPLQRGALYGIDMTQENAGTSHLSIIDADGNAVAMTTSIEAAFGSRLMAGGFLLNNELTDFSLAPRDSSGQPIANRVEAGKRPRSSMAPTMMFDEQGRLEAVLGSVGGSRIILHVVKTLVAMIDWKLDPQAAAGLKNFGSLNGPMEVEIGTPHALSTSWLGFMMRWQGQTVEYRTITSGVHIITRVPGGLEGGADPRREGLALGD